MLYLCINNNNFFVPNMNSTISKDYNSLNHSKFLIKYHIIFVCKYRRLVLANKIIDEAIKKILFEIAEMSDFCIEVMESDKDHIHMMISSVPKISPLSIVRKLKQESTIRIWKEYSGILYKFYWKEQTFWTDGYFVATTGCASQETIEQYIQNQG